MAKKELDLRFHFPYLGSGNCPKCNGRVSWTHHAGAMLPGWHCYSCGWRHDDAAPVNIDRDLLATMGRG